VKQYVLLGRWPHDISALGQRLCLLWNAFCNEQFLVLCTEFVHEQLKYVLMDVMAGNMPTFYIMGK